MDMHSQYMQRCLELAQIGAGSVSPNPMVGAVIVFNGKIIGEGYTSPYGGAHAERSLSKEVIFMSASSLARIMGRHLPVPI